MHADKQHGLHVAIIMDGNGRWATARGCLASPAIAQEWRRCVASWSGHLMWV